MAPSRSLQKDFGTVWAARRAAISGLISSVDGAKRVNFDVMHYLDQTFDLLNALEPSSDVRRGGRGYAPLTPPVRVLKGSLQWRIQKSGKGGAKPKGGGT